MKKKKNKPGNLIRVLAIICALVLCIQAVPFSTSMNIVANAAEKTDEEEKAGEEKSSSASSDEKKSEKTDEEKKEEKTEEGKKEENASDQKDEDKKDSSSNTEKSQDSGNSKTEEKKDQEDKEKDEEEYSKKEDSGKDGTSSKAGEEQNSDSGKTDEKQEKNSDDKKEENSDSQKTGENGTGTNSSEKKENDTASSGKSDSDASENKSGESKEDSPSDGKKASDTGKTGSPEKKDDTKDDSSKKKTESEKDEKAVTDEKTESESASEGKKNEGTGTQRDVSVTIYKGDDEVSSKITIEAEEKFTAKVSGADESISYKWTIAGSAADAVELEKDNEKEVTVSPVPGKKGGEVTLKVVVKSGDTTLGEKTATLDVFTEYGVDKIQIKNGKNKEITDGKADVSDSLSASLTFKSGASDDDKDEDQYSFRWQKKDSEGEFKDIEGSSASSKSYQVNEEGIYRVVLTRAADSDHNRLAYEGHSSSVKASKIPVSVVWENKSRTYDGTAVFSYSGKGTVTRTDDSTSDPWEISPGTAQEITLSGSDAGDYEDVEIPVPSSLDTDIYAVSSSKAKKLTINPYPINAEVTVWGKNFDNTADVKAPTGDSTLSVKWSDLDTALSATEIKDSLQLLLDGNALAYTDLVYSGAGDVDSDTSVSVALKSENASKKFTVSGDTGEGTPKYSNYKVGTVTFADAEIKAVTYEAGTVATNSSGIARGGTVWVDENATIVLAAKESYQIGNDYKNDSDFGDRITADVHKKSEDGTGFDGVVFYAKSANGEIGTVAWESIKVDKTAPTVTMVDVKKISNAEYTNKYTVSDTEAGIGSVKVLISETDQKNATPDDSWTTISLPDDKTAHDTNEFTFEITVPAYGYVYVYAEDQLANKDVTESHVAIYEETPPAVTITCPDASNPTKGKASIKINAEDGDKESGVKSVALSLVDSKGQPVSDAFTVDDTALPDGVTYGNNQFTRSGSDPETLTQAQAYKTLEAQFSISEDKKLDGDYTLSVTALDYCGNSNTATAVLKFDNTAPTFEVSLDDAAGSAVEGTYYYNAASGEGLTVTLFDINLAVTGGAYNALLRDAQNHVLEGSTMVIPAEGDQTRGTISFPASDIKNNLEDGQVTLEVTAADAANNVTSTNGLTKASPESIGKSDGSVSFVLDMTAPELVSSTTTIPEGNNNPNLENSTFYYSGTFKTVATIADLNIDSNYISASFSNIAGLSSGSAQISVSDDGKKLSFSGLKDGFFGYLKVEGKDYAGNPLKVSASFNAGTSDGQDAWVAESQDSGILRTANKREIETQIPLVTVTYKTLDEKRIVGKKAYYKDSITADLTISDIDAEDFERVSVSVKKDGKELEGYTGLKNWDNDGKLSVSFENAGTDDHTIDGDYKILVKGKNRAGTPITVEESTPDGKAAESAVKTEEDKDYSMEYTLVLDTINPLALVEITPDGDVAKKNLNTEYGNRYYFNKKHTAKVTITEKNLNISDEDKGIVKVLYASAKPATKNEEGEDQEDGYTDASQVKFAVSDFTAFSGSLVSDGAEFEYATAVVEGVRQYLVVGEDLAGNPVVYKSEDNKGTIDGSFSDSKEGTFASYPIVTDTVTPLMFVEVTATETVKKDDGSEEQVNRTAYKMDSNGAIYDPVEPYQRAGKATILAKLSKQDTERTPYRFSFHEESTDGTKNDNSNEDYKVGQTLSNTVSSPLNSPLVFWVEDFYVEDLAGNKSATGLKTHNIYLDTEMPVAADKDIIAPTIALYPNIQPDAKYGISGRPLFKTDVPFVVKVMDPNGPKTQNGKSLGSSGLGSISYTLKYTKKDGNEEVLINKTSLFNFDDTIEHGGTTILDESKFKYEVEKSITIAKENNYNSLILTVTALDNVGNESTVTYTFGIDSTKPVITLSYDNNEVKNNSYFKKGRKATITVIERNFDPSLLSVIVTGDAAGSTANNAGKWTASGNWEYLEGSEPNGDDDSYTYTVDFPNDGDYTLSISAGDYEYQLDDQQSQTKYAIVDHAGNPAELTIDDGTEAWSAFVIDQMAPNVSISMAGGFLDGPDKDGHYGYYYYKADNCGIIVSFDDNGHEFGMKGGEYSVTIDDRTDGVSRSLALGKTEPVSYREAQTIEYTEQELAQGDGRLLADGEHVITVKAIDAAGNEATAVLAEKTDFNIASTGCEFDGLNGTFILDTERPQVTKIVTSSTEDISRQAYPISDNKVYEDTDSAYYNKNIQVQIDIEDSYISSKHFEGSFKKNNDTDSIDAVLDDDSDNIGRLVHATYSMEGDNAYRNLLVSGHDKAGNLLLISDGLKGKSDKDADLLLQDDTQSAKGEVSAKYGKVVDKTNPTVRIVYKSDDFANMYTRETERGKDESGKDTFYESAYYNQPINVKISFLDNFKMDGKKLHAGEYNSQTEGEDGIWNKETLRWEYDVNGEDGIVIDKDGRSIYTAYGTDRALNPTKVSEMIPKTDEDHDGDHYMPEVVIGAFDKEIKTQTAFNPVYEMVLDTKRPLITKIVTAANAEDIKGQEYPISDNKVYDDTGDTGCAYYNKNVTVTISIEDTNVGGDESLFEASITSTKSGEIKRKAGTEDKTAKVLPVIFTMSDEDTYTGLTVVGQDKAGNYLQLITDPKVEGCYWYNTEFNGDADVLLQDAAQSAIGEVKAKYGKVVDKTNPTIQIAYESNDYANMYTGETKRGKDGSGKDTFYESAYYNQPITVKMQFKDNYELDGKKLHAGKEGFVSSRVDGATGLKEFNVSPIVIDKDGRSTYTSYGTDRALNPTLVSEMIPNTDASHNNAYKKPAVEAGAFDKELKTQTAFVPVYELVLDQVSPTFTLDVASGKSTNNKLNKKYGNRYYFNKEYTATVKVSDVNYDASKITVRRGSYTSDQYNSSAVKVTSFDETISSDTKVFKDSENEEGIYRYVVFGTDKAGNALIPSSDKDLETIVKKLGNKTISEMESTGSLETEANVSVHVVVDKSQPKGNIVITEDKTEIYVMDTDGKPSLSKPYRKKANALIKFSVKAGSGGEHSPVKIDYDVDSTLDDNAVNGKKTFSGKEYKYNNLETTSQKNKQIFSVKKYVLTDLAGNQTKYGPLNSIYLDVERPIIDELAPITKIVAGAASGTGSYANGQDLFNSDVKLNIKVTDPDADSSSGLAKVTYQMFVGNESVKEDTVILHEENTKEYNGPYADNSSEDNSKIVTEINPTIKVPANSHNYNNLRAVVTAYDNAGNHSEKEYVFGIDITNPTIEVSYDNNDVQNGEFFKKDRKATIVVTERNFDKSKFTIKTQSSASISSWKHKPQKGNGDKDTWTATVTYNKEGNYTLDVSGKDLLGNKAIEIKYNGKAPKKFTIDKTAPGVTVAYDNNNAANGKYYKDNRTARISVTDVNFGGQNDIKVTATGGGVAPSVKFSGNTANLLFNHDGVYIFNGTVTDKAGNTTTIPRQTEFVIDKTAPKVTVTYDNNNAANSKYYKDPRTATISVDDVNFNGQHAIRVSASGGGNAPSVGFSGKTAKLTFDKDGIYIFSGTVTDMAGNTTTIPTQTEFVIDRTAPAVTVTYDNNDVQNGKYYKTARTATVAVNDVNFTGQNTIKVDPSGGGVAPSVAFRGNTAKLPFTEDGIYIFNGTVTDMAGNVTTIPTQSEFVIDTKSPVLRFENGKPFAVIPAVDDKTSDRPKNNQFFTGNTFTPKVTVVDTNCSTAINDAVFQIIGTRSSNHYTGEVGTLEQGAKQFDIFVSSSKFKVESETDDVYTVTAYAIDLAGNKSEEVSFTISINRFGSNYVADEDSGTRAYIRDQYYHNDTDHDLLIREYNPDPIKKDSQAIELVVNGNTASRRKLVLGTEYEFKEDAESKVGGRIYLYTIKKSVFEHEGDYSFTISSEDEAGHKNSTARVHYDKDENGNPTEQEVHSFPIEFVVDKTAPTNQLVGVSSNAKQAVNQDHLTMEIHPEDTQTAVSEVEVRRWKTSADFFGNPSTPDKGAAPDQITVYRYFENGAVPADEGNTNYADLSEYTNADTDKIVIDYSIKGGSDWQVVEVITTDLAGNKSTDIREGGTSEEGMTLNESRRSYLVTTDLLTRLINNPAIRIGLIVLAGLIIVLVILRRRKKAEE